LELGRVEHVLGRLDEAEASLTAALLEAGPADLPHIHLQLGMTRAHNANAEGAWHHLEIAREGLRAMDDVEESKAIVELARLMMLRGDRDEAFAMMREVVAMHRERGNQERLAATLGKLGGMCFAAYRYADAEAYLLEALALASSVGDRYGESVDRTNLGLLYSRMGRLEEAFVTLEEALVAHREAGFAHGEAHTLAVVGELRSWLGLEGAEDYLREAVAIHDQSGQARLRSSARHALGSHLVRCGGSSEAIALFEEARALSRGAGDRLAAANLEACLGMAWQEHGDLRAAAVHLHEALARMEELAEPQYQGLVLMVLAGVVASTDPEESLVLARRAEALAEASRTLDRCLWLQARARWAAWVKRPADLAEALSEARSLADQLELGPASFYRSWLAEIAEESEALGVTPTTSTLDHC